MKSVLFTLIISCLSWHLQAQNHGVLKHSANIRLSFLLFPFSPLLTAELSASTHLTLQAESNFKQTHGINVKYFTQQSMSGHYFLFGTALVSNTLLRKDAKPSALPYLGYGYAYRFGKNSQWTFDSRFGIGATINADRNSVYPIIKTGLGRIIF
jgi:hypothetical protein